VSWSVVARKDFDDPVRSRMLWAITALFVAFTAGTIYALNLVMTELTRDGAARLVTVPVSLIVPITALVAAYMAIAGERESGSIKLLLGLPHTRADVVFGKLVGRTGVVTIAVLVSFVAAAVVLVALFGSLAVGGFVVLALVTVLFAATFVAIAVGISAFTASRSRAMAAAVGVFILFQILWDYVPMGVYYLVDGAMPSGTQLPAWYFLMVTLNPKNAYSMAAGLAFPDGATAAAAQGMTVADRIAGGVVPFYLQDWFSLLILLAWLALPVLLGYYRFERADLG